MKVIRLLAATSLALVTAIGAVEAQSKYTLTLSGASPGGLWSKIGAGIDAAIAAAYPGSTVTYQTSSGGLANVPLVSKGSVPMGLATDGELTVAWTGQAPFKSSMKNVRVLFRAYTPAARFQATHLILNKDFADKHGIASLADLKAKKPPVRMAINRRGNMDSVVSRMVMEQVGIPLDDIKGWGGQVVNAASKEIVSLMLDRRIDFANYGIAYKHPTVRQIAKGVTPVLLDIPASVVKSVANKLGGEPCVFKKGDYAFAAGQINSICIGAIIVANANMPDATAYAITKALHTQIEVFKSKSHRLIKKTATPQTLATPAIAPFHPGSIKYLKEAGLM
jgi:hypothetical protein